MGNVTPAITQQTFLGATIIGFNTTANWGEQSFTLNIDLVEDPLNGDDFLLKESNTNNMNGGMMGQPQQFTYGSFSFAGLLLSYDEIRTTSEYPVYRVVLVSATRVLAAVQVILAGYVGPGNDSVFNSSPQLTSTFQITNFLNVYGWAEDGGLAFGRSQETDVGMFWNGTYGVKNGIETLSSTPSPPANGLDNFYWGSYITYKGNLYQIDLSAMPVPPDFYMIGGVVNMTLLELISRFCQDAGVDYMVNLTLGNGNGPHTISFLTVPRLLQPQLGQITQFINSQTAINEVSHGEEVRDDITQAMLVGGQINFLQPLQNIFFNNGPLNQSSSNTIMPFWGFDTNGFPILGYKFDPVTGQSFLTAFADDNTFMNLNGSPIADILTFLGLGITYTCSVLELRCALTNFETWYVFMQANKLPLLIALGIPGATQITQIPIVPGFNLPFLEFTFDFIRDDVGLAIALANANNSALFPALVGRLYEFVRQTAEQYYGKKFIVQLPFNIQIKLVPFTATNAVVLSDEISDAGYMPENSNILNLNFINEQYFLDDTGRFQPFVRYEYENFFNSIYIVNSTLGPANIPLPARPIYVDLSRLDPTNFVVQAPGVINIMQIFSHCQQGTDGPVQLNGVIGGGSQIFFANFGQAGLPTPATVVEVPQAVFGLADDITGNVLDLEAMIGIAAGSFGRAINTNPIMLTIHPPAIYPDAIAVALKSNQYIYGPWGKFQTDGKLNFEQDESLTPWNCGDYTTMNNVARAKLALIALGNQVLERAQLTEAGMPSYNLMQTLFQGGPVINSVSTSINLDGVKTTYTLETFVNRIAAFSQENALLLQRIGKIYQQLRRTIRAQFEITNIKNSYWQASVLDYVGTMPFLTYALQPHTQHDVLGGYLAFSQSTNTYVPVAFTQTRPESVKNVNASGLNPDIFQEAACMGMEGLLRPYTTNVNNDMLPYYFQPDPIVTGLGSYAPTSRTLNPFVSGCDLTWVLTGDEYTRLNNRLYPDQINFDNMRALALRGPLVIQGWGFDLAGNPVPNTNTPFASLGKIYPLVASGHSAFPQNYLTNSIDWPTGPLFTLWDKFTASWVAPGMVICGVLSGDVPAQGSGYLNIWINQRATNEVLPVCNFFSDSPALSGYRAIVGYERLSNRWVITSMGCAIG